MAEINSVSGANATVSVRPTGGVAPTGVKVTVKVPIGPSNDSPSESGTRDYGQEAADLYERNERNSGRSTN